MVPVGLCKLKCDAWSVFLFFSHSLTNSAACSCECRRGLGHAAHCFEEVTWKTVHFKTRSFVSASKHTFQSQLLLPSLHPSAKPLVPSWHARFSVHWQIRRDPPSLREAISCICPLADLTCTPLRVQAGVSLPLFMCWEASCVFAFSVVWYVVERKLWPSDSRPRLPLLAVRKLIIASLTHVFPVTLTA